MVAAGREDALLISHPVETYGPVIVNEEGGVCSFELCYRLVTRLPIWAGNTRVIHGSGGENAYEYGKALYQGPWCGTRRHSRNRFEFHLENGPGQTADRQAERTGG
ncbi:hypothetical protein Psi02_04270 [Planotetraspora silvatica]|uniref:Uncharacterized protein n=1 Tax=Planotetraspora silvatica TaxID=234614 RepID=A0A8J3UEY2_9ACTN|nr:hypothetical protein Psi02_04270 [Planotetraspora silvatica]